jgi:hypothetical protein
MGVLVVLAVAVLVSACTQSPDRVPPAPPATDPHLRRLPNGGAIWDQGRKYRLPPGALVRVVNVGRDSGRPEQAEGVIDDAVVIDFDLNDPYCAESDYQWKHISDPELIQCAVPYQEGLVVAYANH